MRLKRIVERCRLSDVVALAAVDAQVLEQVQGRLVADKLCDRLLVEPPGDPHDGLNDQPVDGRVDTPGHKFAINLQVIERQVLEVVEAAEAGAEIIEGEVKSQLPEPLGELLG